LESLIPLVDRELRTIARRRLEAKRSDPILDTTTALVNEAYLRLIDWKQSGWRDRAHFFAVCAKIMRRILVDHARAHRTAKRGGGAAQISLNEALVVPPGRASDLVAIDEALEALAKIDARKGRVVELRFFGGLSIDETAAVLQVSPETVRRDWRLAKAWLRRELDGEETP
jgi:RNA polymerase sigma factor (TIGR02999 family)